MFRRLPRSSLGRRCAARFVTPEQIDASRRLLAALKARSYHFVTPTPATHARVVARKRTANDLRDVFGWSLPFSVEILEPEVFGLLESAGALVQRGDAWASSVRVSSLGELPFLHSAYPTTAPDSVFFGPDSYRFASFLMTELPKAAPRHHVVDIGAGSGVGAAMATCFPDAMITLADINPTALDFARANLSQLHNAKFSFIESDGLAAIDGAIDCIIANPPYIADPDHRLYRDGGAMHGGALSLRWAREAAKRLEPGGLFALYMGSAIVDGRDALKAALHEALSDFHVAYREIDPDVFGEELERADYADVERIAVIGLVAIKKR